MLTERTAGWMGVGPGETADKADRGDGFLPSREEAPSLQSWSGSRRSSPGKSFLDILVFFFLFIFLISNEAAHALLFLQGLFLIFPGVSFLWIWKFALCVASHPFQSVSSERVLQTSSLVTEALWLLDKFL